MEVGDEEEDGDEHRVYTWEMTTDESGYQNFTRKRLDEQD